MNIFNVLIETLIIMIASINIMVVTIIIIPTILITIHMKLVPSVIILHFKPGVY